MKRTNEQMVAEYQSTKSEAVLKEIIKANVGLMNILINPYVESIPNAEFEDLYQEATAFPMMKAIEDYDPTQGVAFCTLLKAYVRQHLNRIYNHEHREKRYPDKPNDSLDRLAEICKDGDIDDRNFTVECKDYKSIEFKDLLESIKFTEKERVVVNVLMNGGTNGDCSELLQIAPSSVTYYFKQIGKKLALAGYAI